MTTQVEDKVIFTIEVRKAEDIEKAINESKEVESRVNGYLSMYSLVSIPETMKALSNIGELLKVANAASYGQKNNHIIKGILNDYQSLIYDTIITTSQFVSSCIACIKKLKSALVKASKLEIKGCIKSIQGTGKKATEMKELSDKLVKQSEDLSAKALSALEESTEDYTNAITEYRANEKKKGELNSTIEGLKVEVEALKEQITELQELEDTAREEAEEEARWSGFLSFLRGIVKGIKAAMSPINFIKDQLATVQGEIMKVETAQEDISTTIMSEKQRITKERSEKKEQAALKSNELLLLVQKEEKGALTSEESEKKDQLQTDIKGLEKEIEVLKNQLKKAMGNVTQKIKDKANDLENKEKEFRKYKNQYIELEIKTSGELNRSIADLESLSKRNDYLQMSAKSLEIVIISMGKIRTTFENCRIFWTQVSSHCEALSNVDQIVNISKIVRKAGSDPHIKFQNTLRSMCISWLSLAKVNHDANLEIEKVKEKFDLVMTNLPGKDQSSEIVKTCIDGIQKNALEDKSKLEQLRNLVASASTKESQK